jgi:hypothetical protein
MYTQTLALALLAATGLVSATPTHVQLHARQNKNAGNNGGNNGGNNAAAGGNNAATGTTLNPAAIQSGSFVDGSVNGALKDGQAASATSKNNFINNCVGKTLTNGLQVTAGSCNGIRKQSG